MSEKSENPGGQAGASCNCKGRSCKDLTTSPRPNQAKLHPMTRRGLDNLRLEIESQGIQDLTTESALRAVAFLLENY